MPLPARMYASSVIRAALVVLLIILALPLSTFAATDLASGQTAVVSGTGGDPINLRAKPDISAPILGTVSEGQTVIVLTGPIWGDAGIAWYKIDADGTRAYISAEFLSAPDSAPVGTVTGSATIENTGGDPINCRSGAGSDYSVITTVSEGDSVDLTGSPLGAWQPVNCGGTGGYIHTDFISTAPSSGAGETATIVNTDGDQINCRADASERATILTSFAEGDTVTLNGALVNSWQPVICAGTTGYITNIYLSTGDTDSMEPDPTETSGIGTVTGTGVIMGTNGDGANCRSARSIRSSIWALLPEGTTIQLRGDSNGTWVPIYCNGNRGYVSAQFVGGDGTDPDTGGSARFSVGQNVEVANTGGQGVRLRSKASSSASIIVVLPEGQGAMVRAGSSGEWVAVTYRTTNGFIHQDYLAAVTETNPTPTPTPEPGDGLRTNDHASVTDLVNFRETPSLTGTVISSVEEDTVVLITGAKQNGYYPVTVGGFAGYIHGDYLTYTTKDLTGGSEGVGGLTPGNGRTTPQARKMISYAKKYL
ncbi:MAG TPA: SH3 domain-containing protein, partial [Thermomicrobiales bacterium]|nr:SH3 domain-containing protein [Thermomicrobiales bacterium]